VTKSLFEGKSNKPKTEAGERVAVPNEAALAALREYQQKHYLDAEPGGWLLLVSPPEGVELLPPGNITALAMSGLWSG
jgi:hypothetical protein